MKAVISILLISFAQSALALDPEARVLLPQTGRSPAEAGLESGRYQEVEQKDIATWEKKRNAEIEQDLQRAPSANESQDFPTERTGSKIKE